MSLESTTIDSLRRMSLDFIGLDLFILVEEESGIDQTDPKISD